MNTTKQDLEPLRILKNDNTKTLKVYPKLQRKNIQENKLYIPTLNEKLFLKLEDILYCKANGSYTIIYSKNTKTIIVSKVLKWMEERLPKSDFIRVHHSYIVQKNIISNLHLSTISNITLFDKTKISVARSRKQFVASELSNTVYY